MYEIYQELLDKNKIKSADVSRATGISNMTLSDWKRGVSVPKTDKMQKIADYFGVSLDYLLNGKPGTALYTYNKISNLCRDRGTSIDDVEKQLNFEHGYISSIKNGAFVPSSRLKLIARYFDVSVDYLTNGEEKEGSEKYYLNDETAEMAQKIFENKELRALFDVQSDMQPEDLKALHDMALALKRKERREYGDTGC